MALAETATAAHSPQEYRDRLADHLLVRPWVSLSSPEVEAAVRTVPRHLFVPSDVDLAAAYADDVVITKRDAHGKPTSSVSAP
ncbi:hypothetical protein AB0M36_18390 [Actinoplanes sp. NPDC051346]|uniref:hypothetical protein n=1 Tax=Actinoplanes sp. NPDC051346 TaxID=3155048 RepID=UPI0034300841